MEKLSLFKRAHYLTWEEFERKCRQKDEIYFLNATAEESLKNLEVENV